MFTTHELELIHLLATNRADDVRRVIATKDYAQVQTKVEDERYVTDLEALAAKAERLITN